MPNPGASNCWYPSHLDLEKLISWRGYQYLETARASWQELWSPLEGLRPLWQPSHIPFPPSGFLCVSQDEPSGKLEGKGAWRFISVPGPRAEWRRVESKSGETIEKTLLPLLKVLSSKWSHSTGCWGFFFFFSWLHPQHMEVPRPGIESELQLQQTRSFNPLHQPGIESTSSVIWAAAVRFLPPLLHSRNSLAVEEDFYVIYSKIFITKINVLTPQPPYSTRWHWFRVGQTWILLWLYL